MFAFHRLNRIHPKPTYLRNRRLVTDFFREPGNGQLFPLSSIPCCIRQGLKTAVVAIVLVNRMFLPSARRPLAQCCIFKFFFLFGCKGLSVCKKKITNKTYSRCQDKKKKGKVTVGRPFIIDVSRIRVIPIKFFSFCGTKAINALSAFKRKAIAASFR